MGVTNSGILGGYIFYFLLGSMCTHQNKEIEVVYTRVLVVFSTAKVECIVKRDQIATLGSDS